MSENALLWIIGLPLGAGVLAYLVPRRAGAVAKVLALAVAVVCFYLALRVFLHGEALTWEGWKSWPFLEMERHVETGPAALLTAGPLARLVLLAAAFFALAMTLYAIGSAADVPPGPFYANILWAVAGTFGVILSADLVLLVVFWGFMGIPFFLLINMGREGADAAAKKTLIVLGGTDSLMILGVALVWYTVGHTRIGGAGYPVALTTGAGVCGCLFLAIAAFAKAGAMPFHSWLPDAAETAPVSVTALLPASLDKLLGIFLFSRICLEWFSLTGTVRVAFVLVGAITVIAAVMAALVQHNVFRLLGFHAVSQVGYMVIGVATGTALGVVGGLFHMFNNAIYKSCLVLTAGAAKRRSGTAELDRMGGLARAMPVTFICAAIAALAISGVPPMNGFASKWMVYQGLIAGRESLGVVWVVALVLAMIGSALTLASFVKVLHSVFLGQPPGKIGGQHTSFQSGQDPVSFSCCPPIFPKPNALMGAPMVVLALLCVFLGVFAVAVPVRGFLEPALADHFGGAFAGNTWVGKPAAVGFWDAGTATVLILVGLVLGLVIMWLSRLKVREDAMYVGGETGKYAERFRFPGTEFYQTVRDLGPLSAMYRHAEGLWYDLYHLGRRLVLYASGALGALHSGILSTYLAWCVLGVVILLWVFIH